MKEKKKEQYDEEYKRFQEYNYALGKIVTEIRYTRRIEKEAERKKTRKIIERI